MLLIARLDSGSHPLFTPPSLDLASMTSLLDARLEDALDMLQGLSLVLALCLDHHASSAGFKALGKSKDTLVSIEEASYSYACASLDWESLLFNRETFRRLLTITCPNHHVAEQLFCRLKHPSAHPKVALLVFLRQACDNSILLS